MNHRRIALLLSVSAPLAVVGDDSSVYFANGSPVGLPRVYNVDGSPIHSANYVAQLFMSTDGGTSFSAVGIPAPFFNVTPTSVRAGVWKSESITLNGVSPGSVVSMKVAVWDSTIFPNWDSTAGALKCPPTFPGNPVSWDFQLGITPAFSYKSPAQGVINPVDYNLLNFPGLTLTQPGLNTGSCPEPSTVALSLIVLGGVGYVGWRRKAIRP